jgi:hypothetical protein
MWRRRLLALFFIAQYHSRMSLLSLRFKARGITRSDINTLAREHWHKLCQALATHTLLNETLKNAQQTLENKRLQIILHTAKKRLEKLIFVEETPPPTQDLSTLKAAWHTLETSKLPLVVPEKLRNAWHTLETRMLPSIEAEKFKTVGQSRKTLELFQHPRRALGIFGALALLLSSLFALHGISQMLTTPQTAVILTVPQIPFPQLNPAAQNAANINASQSLARLSQLDESQYSSQSEYHIWAYSACSAAAMTAVFNAYGHHYRITDVLKVEASIGEITPQLGLLEHVGIEHTAARFGFRTTWGNNWTLAQVKSNANAGHPVIVGWPPSRYDGGHIVVVTGGDANTVTIADSSLWNRHVLTNAQFMQWWAGFAAVVTPL